MGMLAKRVYIKIGMWFDGIIDQIEQMDRIDKYKFVDCEV
jgi:hypothetical protein